MEITNEELLDKIEKNKQSIMIISDLLTKSADGLYKLTEIVNQILKDN